MKKKNIVPSLATAFLTFMVLGCGSNPSNCLTNTQIVNFMSANGINDCAIAGCAVLGVKANLHSVGSGTYLVCGAIGNSYCGTPEAGTTCNMMVQVVTSKYEYDCVFPWGTYTGNKCESLFMWNVTTDPCNPSTSSNPSACRVLAPN